MQDVKAEFISCTELTICQSHKSNDFWYVLQFISSFFLCHKISSFQSPQKRDLNRRKTGRVKVLPDIQTNVDISKQPHQTYNSIIIFYHLYKLSFYFAFLVTCKKVCNCNGKQGHEVNKRSLQGSLQFTSLHSFEITYFFASD